MTWRAKLDAPTVCRDVAVPWTLSTLGSLAARANCERRRHKAHSRNQPILFPPSRDRADNRLPAAGPSGSLSYRTNEAAVKPEVGVPLGPGCGIEIGGQSDGIGGGRERSWPQEDSVEDQAEAPGKASAAAHAEPAGGARSAPSAGKARTSSIARMVRGSRMRAISRNRPPQAGQASTSTSKARRRINWAQAQLRRGGRVTAPSSPEASVPVETSAAGTGSATAATP